MATPVQINVPDADRTVRSPTDALRFVTASIVGVLTILVVLIFPDVFGGLGQDLSEIFDDASGAIPEIAGLVVTALVLAVPSIILLFFIRERDLRRLVVVVPAALIAAVATGATISWIADLLAEEVLSLLTGNLELLTGSTQNLLSLGVKRLPRDLPDLLDLTSSLIRTLAGEDECTSKSTNTIEELGEFGRASVCCLLNSLESPNKATLSDESLTRLSTEICEDLLECVSWLE